MKKKLALLFFPVLLFIALLTSCDGSNAISGKSFVSPGRTIYETGETLDLTGGKIIYYYEDNEITHELTTQMLDSSTIPTFEEAGEFTISGSYDGFDFKFEISIVESNDLLGISFVAPGRTIYETGDVIDLTGGKIVYYYEKEEVSVELTTQMLDGSTIPTFEEAGEYTILGSKDEFAFEFKIVIEEGNDLLGTSFVAPGRTIYETGDVLDLTGGKIVYYYEKEEVIIELTTQMLDSSTIPTFEEAGDYTILGSKDGFEFEFEITINEKPVYLKDVEVSIDNSITNYVRSMDVAQYILCREVYSNNTNGEWYEISADDVDSITINNGEASINLSFYINNNVVNKVIKLPVADDSISVKQLKESTVGSSYVVKGVVISVATTVSRTEVIIADKETGDLISVSGLENSGTVQGMTLDINVEVGDEIIVPVTLKTSSLSSDSNKLYAEFSGGSHVYNTVVSKDNVVTLDYTNVATIDSQADLVDMLSSANRGSNVYKVVKLIGQMNFITYQTSRHFRFWFEDGNISNYDGQKIEGNMSPCFSDGAQYYTTGTNFAELVFNDPNFVSEDWSAPATKVVEMYALFIGGNGYYHEFVILSNDLYKELEIKNTNTYFVAPENTNYILDSTLSIEGAKIVKEFDLRSDEVIEVTMDMLDTTTIPDFKTEGSFTVKGSYEGFEFEFVVTVESKKVSGIIVETMPSKLVYGHRDSLETLDLTGGELLLEYSNGTYETIPMDSSMLPATDDNWKIGQVEYLLTYGGCTTAITVTYENQALTIAEALNGKVGQKYEVTGIVVGPASSAGAIELLIKDKNSNTTVGVLNSKVAGSAAAPALDTEYVNTGDEIIVTLTLKQSSTTGGSYGKLYLDGNVTTSLIVVSKGNSVAYNDSEAFVIDSQEKLVEFINSEDRFYKYVKVVQPKSIKYNNYLRFYFDSSITTLAAQKINEYSPVFHTVSNDVYCPEFINYFDNNASTKYSNPITTTYSFYSIFVGGNGYYHIFTTLKVEGNAA